MPQTQLTGNEFSRFAVYADYVFLDTTERRRFAQNAHEYLIDQLQIMESVSAINIKLAFNHPVKELLWVVQRDSFVDCSYPTWMAAFGGQQPFNYSDDFSTEGSIMSLLSAAGSSARTNGALPTGVLGAGNTTAFSTASTGFGAGVTELGLEGRNDEFDYGVNYLLAKVILASGVRCEGKNPLEVCKLQLNGQDRFVDREGSYFSSVQPYQHHTRTPSTGINVYSFALRPEEHQPSGTCNFSRIDKATLQLTVSINTVLGARTAQVRVYALNYNVLRVMSGMGGLAYSN
jgi:hypothetical protein